MRNSILMSAFGVSMEGADPTENVEINPVTEQTTVAVDEALDEMREAEDVAEEHEEAVEELSEVAESLESLIASLESAIDAGGMSEQTADLHGRAMHIATRRLPIDASDYTVSTESFGRDGDKMTASMEALEKTKDMLSKIWNAIKTAVQKAWEAAKNFVQTLGKSAGALKRAGALLQAQSANVNDSGTAVDIDVSSLAKYLAGEDGTIRGLVSQNLAQVVTGGDKIRVATKKYAQVAAKGGEPKHEYPKELPGGRFIRTGDDGIPTLSAQGTPSDKKVSMKAWNKAEIAAVGKAIVSVAEMLEKFDKADFKQVFAEIDKQTKKLDSEVKKANQGRPEEVAATRRDLAHFKKVASATRAIAPQYMSFAASAAKAAFNAGKKSVAAHSAKATPAKKEDADK